VIDDFCKQLVVRHPASIGGWVLRLLAQAEGSTTSEPVFTAAIADANWQVLDRELSSAPLHADSVILLPRGGDPTILHLEFQTRPDAAIAERMLEYWIRLHRRFHQPIRQVVIHLKPTASALARIDQLAIGRTLHHFSNLRLWEQEPEPLLADPALLPLAVLARPAGEPREQLLAQVRERLQEITDADQRRFTTSGCQLLAGLAFPPDVIQRLLAMSILEDSSVYQLIVRKGLQEGRELGRELGLQEGRQLEAAALVLRLLERRCGPLSDAQRGTIRGLNLERLEQLGDALLDFQGPADLAAWLA
jgi:predicted transposase/invertase (TIGR01784 family)